MRFSLSEDLLTNGGAPLAADRLKRGEKTSTDEMSISAAQPLFPWLNGSIFQLKFRKFDQKYNSDQIKFNAIEFNHRIDFRKIESKGGAAATVS